MARKKSKNNKFLLVIVLLIFIGLVVAIYDFEKSEKISSNKKAVEEKDKNEKKSLEDEKNLNMETPEAKEENDTVEKDLPKEEVKENKEQNKPKNYNVSLIELIGEEEVSISVGEKYEEKGAKAYNTDNEDISEKIKIDSNVDTTKVGTYTVSYSIGNWIVIRRVMVK